MRRWSRSSAARRIFCPSSDRKPCTVSQAAGFSMKSTAPSASTSIVRYASARNTPQSRITGISSPASRSSCMSWTPSIPTVARSKVSTSGRARRQRSTAADAESATPATSKPRTMSDSARSRRMNAEPSATATRRGLSLCMTSPGPSPRMRSWTSDGRPPHRPEGGVVAREDVEQRRRIDLPGAPGAGVARVHARLPVEVEVDVEAHVEPLERLEHALRDVEVLEDFARRLRRDQVHDPRLIGYGCQSHCPMYRPPGLRGLGELDAPLGVCVRLRRELLEGLGACEA